MNDEYVARDAYGRPIKKEDAVCWNCNHFWMQSNPYARVGGRCHYNPGGGHFGDFVEYDSGCARFENRIGVMRYDGHGR